VLAEARRLQRGAVIILPDPGVDLVIPDKDPNERTLFVRSDHWLLERRDMLDMRTDRKALLQCTDELGRCEIRECEECAPTPTPLFAGPGWPAIIGGGIAVLAGGVVLGVVIGVEAARPKIAAP